jgi:hypothetical protein
MHFISFRPVCGEVLPGIPSLSKKAQRSEEGVICSFHRKLAKMTQIFGFVLFKKRFVRIQFPKLENEKFRRK